MDGCTYSIINASKGRLDKLRQTRLGFSQIIIRQALSPMGGLALLQLYYLSVFYPALSVYINAFATQRRFRLFINATGSSTTRSRAARSAPAGKAY